MKFEELPQLPVYIAEDGEYTLLIRSFDQEQEDGDDDVTDVASYISGLHTDCAWLWEITWDRPSGGPDTIAAGRCYGDSSDEALKKSKACGEAVLEALTR